MLNVLFHSFLKLCISDISLNTLDVILAFVFDAIVKHFDESVQDGVPEDFCEDVMPHRGILTIIPSKVLF